MILSFFQSNIPVKYRDFVVFKIRQKKTGKNVSSVSGSDLLEYEFIIKVRIGAVNF